MMILIPTKSTRLDWEQHLRSSLCYADLFRTKKYNAGPVPAEHKHYDTQMESDYLAALSNICNRDRYDPRLLPVPLDLAANMMLSDMGCWKAAMSYPQPPVVTWYFVYDIDWDTSDCACDVGNLSRSDLPRVLLVPLEAWRTEAELEDMVTDISGYCHNGFKYHRLQGAS